MEEKDFILEKLTFLLHVGIFCQNGDALLSYEETPQYNPLYVCTALREKLAAQADAQNLPAIFLDDYGAGFVCIKNENRYYFLGPVSTREMSFVERHRFYHAYGVDQELEKGLHHHTEMEMLQMTEVFANRILGKEYEDQELVDANHLLHVSKMQEENDWEKYRLHEAGEDIYRHTYQEERKILDMVRQGKPEEAVRLTKEMDAEVGKLANDELGHWRNLLTVIATVCARAAIEGGLEPRVAYQVSGFYINKGSGCKDAMQVLSYRNHAVEELAERVRAQNEKPRVSNHTNQCKDYIQKHFNEKIYLDDIAETLQVSSSYLSRLFKKETGMNISDYVNEVRVERSANLLVYSNESLSAIAEYVNFPSQSYFGKIFKKYKGMTPRQYREKNKPAEFCE